MRRILPRNYALYAINPTVMRPLCVRYASIRRNKTESDAITAGYMTNVLKDNASTTRGTYANSI
jgi:hypothetical protein